MSDKQTYLQIFGVTIYGWPATITFIGLMVGLTLGVVTKACASISVMTAKVESFPNAGATTHQYRGRR